MLNYIPLSACSALRPKPLLPVLSQLDTSKSRPLLPDSAPSSPHLYASCITVDVAPFYAPFPIIPEPDTGT